MRRRWLEASGGPSVADIAARVLAERSAAADIVWPSFDPDRDVILIELPTIVLPRIDRADLPDTRT